MSRDEYTDTENDEFLSGPESLSDPARMPPDLAKKVAEGLGKHAHDKARRVAAELATRKLEPLNLYQPTLKQDEYHACMAKECLFQAGNQIGKALDSATNVATPSGMTPISMLSVGDMVIAGDGTPTKVLGVYPQGERLLYEVKFNDGATVYADADHLWEVQLNQDRTGTHQWRVLTTIEVSERIRKGRNRPLIRTAAAQFASSDVEVDPYILGLFLGDGCLRNNSAVIHSIDDEVLEAVACGIPDCCELVEVGGERSVGYRIAQSNKKCGSKRNAFSESLRRAGVWGKRAWEKEIPHSYLFNSIENRIQLLRGLMDTDGSIDEKGKSEFSSTSYTLAKQVQWIVRSLGGRATFAKRQTSYTSPNQRIRKKGRVSYRLYIRLDEFNPFRLSRKAVRWIPSSKSVNRRSFVSIRPAMNADATCIRVSHPSSTFMLGDNFIVTHNSLAGFIEDARAVLGCDPFDKYPKENGRLAIVGYKESHIALNVHRYLLQPGAFDIIRDQETGLWRTFHPWVPEDAARKLEAIPAPAMLPDRYIKHINWKSKSGCIFKRIDLTTGWQIHAFSSTAKPDQGFKLDLAHIDEDIINENWYPELMARLSMRQGRLRWTALPHNENDALNRVAERGEKEMDEHARGGPKPTTLIVRATIFDNPYMTEETKQENIKRWKAIGEDEYRKRALGELVTDTIRMYPTFTPNVHAVQRYGKSHTNLFGEYLRTREIPDDWCLRLFVDPGFDTLGALLIATLPDETCHIAVRELYLHQCTATIFGLQVERLLRGRWTQCNYMDAHGGALTSSATGIRPQEAYEIEMRKRKVLSVETRHRFRPACDSIEYRETMTRERLAIMPDGNGLPDFLYDEEFCPNLEMEMTRFRKQKIKGEVIDKGNRRKRTHLVECLEYAAAENLTFHKPPKRQVVETRSERRTRAYLERKAQKKRKAASAFGNLNGGIILGS